MHQTEAKLLYKDGDYEIINFGSHVYCAVTRKKILLNNLAYWSVSRQEAYIDCAAAFKREAELGRFA